ncbi:MAG: O-antigen ligase family protein [Selenomonadales bacterium]|jgi:tetratricopeptide (TPR) repeat protein|nr:O-antigen ligase family protein [Selenomonadales bacterium]
MGKRKQPAPSKPTNKSAGNPTGEKGGSALTARRALLAVVVAVVVLSPFVQGLYWPQDKLLVSAVVLALACGALVFGVGKKPLPWSLGHALGSLLVLLYAMGLFRPASMNGALRGLVLWAGFVALYWLVSSLELGERERKLLLGGVVAGGAVLALVGLAVYSGVYDAPAQLVGGRISAGFEYPNATASLFMASLLISIVLGFQETSLPWRVLWSASGAVTIPAFLLTLSRGGYLALAAGVLLTVVVCYRRFFELFSFLVFMGAPGLIATYLMVTQSGLTVLLAVPVLAGLTALAEAGLVQKHARTAGKAILALALALGVALTVFGATRVVPAEVAGYFSRITLRGLLDDGRFVFFEDGLHALRGSPLLGFGGGAWNAVYPRYQSFHYGTLRAHSDPLDITLEIGILGLVIYLAFMLVNMYWAWKRRAEPAAAAIGILAFAVLFHSVGEALLAFPSMYLLLFAALGALSAQGNRYAFRFDMRPVLAPTLGLLLLLGGALYLAELEMARVPALAQAGKVDEIMASLQRTLSVNPWHADARRELDNMMQHRSLPDAAQRANLEALLRHEPFDPRATNLLGHWHAARANHAAAVRYHERSMALQPRNIQNYETLALTAASAALAYRARGQEGWQSYVDKVFSVHQQFEQVRAAIPEHLLPKSAVPFALTPALQLALGEGYLLRANQAAALPHLVAAERSRDAQIAARAGLVLARVYELQGRSHEALALIAKYSTAAGLADYMGFLRLAIR